MEAPCKDCAERSVGCHGTCARYAEYRGFLDKQKRDIEKHIEEGAYFCELSAKFNKYRRLHERRQSRRRN